MSIRNTAPQPFGRRAAALVAAALVCLGVAPYSEFFNAGFETHAVLFQCSNRVVDENRDGVTRKAVILSKPDAKMTDSARRNKVEGVVVLSIVLSASGKVTDITTVEGLPYGLTEAAIGAAEQIRFEPALKDGCPISQRLKVQYEFRL